MFTWMTVRHNTEKNALNEESHRSATSHWQNLLNKIVLSTPNHEWGVGIKLNAIAVIGTDGIYIYIGSQPQLLSPRVLCLIQIISNNLTWFIYELMEIYWLSICLSHINILLSSFNIGRNQSLIRELPNNVKEDLLLSKNKRWERKSN